LRAFSGAGRAVLIDNSEHLSLQAANALLKALEEPRPGTHFCLVTSNCSRLPRTLVSRCQVWFFDALKPDEIKLILQAQADSSTVPAEHIDKIAFLADGAMDNIEAISSNMEAWNELQTTLENIFKGDLAAAQSAAQQLSRDRDSLRDKLKLMRIYARQRMQETQDRGRRSRWAVCVANLLESDRLIFERNINAQYLLSSLFLSLANHPGLETFTTLTNSDTLLGRHLG
jgi:DNA polymerase-3 subunit delta'